MIYRTIISNKDYSDGRNTKDLKSQLTCGAHLPGESGFFLSQLKNKYNMTNQFTPDPQDQQAFENFLNSLGTTTDYSTWSKEQLIERIIFLEAEQQSLMD